MKLALIGNCGGGQNILVFTGGHWGLCLDSKYGGGRMRADVIVYRISFALIPNTGGQNLNPRRCVLGTALP